MTSSKPPKRLAGLRVVLTRAGEDNDFLAKALRLEGAIPILLPCLQITDVDHPTDWQMTLRDMPTPAGVIITSKQVASRLQPSFPDHFQNVAIYCVGPSTQQQMQEAGFPVHAIPDSDFSSEGLLTLPVLHDVKAQTWLIIGGENPRPLLIETLKERGATVTYLSVYRRLRPQYSAASIARLAEEKPTVFIVTSLACLQNLAYSLEQSDRHDLWQCALVLVSPRYQDKARSLGFTGPIWLSDNATDQQIVNTLINQETNHV